MTTTARFKNFEFLPELKAAAVEKYGADGFLIMNREYSTEVLLPPTWEYNPWPGELDGLFQTDDVFYTRKDDQYVSSGCSSYQAVANPGWPLTLTVVGREYALKNISKAGGGCVALYRSVPDGQTANRIYAILTHSGLDITARPPFPA